MSLFVLDVIAKEKGVGEAALQPISPQESGLRWLTLTDAIRQATSSHKNILVNIRAPKNPADSLLEIFLNKNAQVAQYIDEHFVLVNLDTEHNKTFDFEGKKVTFNELGLKVFHAGLGDLSAALCKADGQFLAYLSRYGNPQHTLDLLRFCVEEHYVTRSWRDYIDDCEKLRSGKKLFAWHTYSEGMQLALSTHKKVLINAFDSFSPYSFRMKDITYADPGIMEYINTYFIPVRVDIDGLGMIDYANRPVKPDMLLTKIFGLTAFPSTLFYEGNGAKLGMVRGYKNPEAFELILQFFAKEEYKNDSLEAYLRKHGISN